MNSLEVADVFRQFGPSYVQTFGQRMLPSHRRALDAIIACRTPAMGGHAFRCCDCQRPFYVYHGCGNRACPACHSRHIEAWRAHRTDELLPCPYYHVCVTVPQQLHAVFRANQRVGYGLLLQVAAQAVLALCRDPRYIGATPAVLAVLHTWTTRMDYHPHVHLLVSGGGLAPDGLTWREAKHPFLVPVRALSKCVRGKVHATFTRDHPELLAQIPPAVWNTNWVAWCKCAGQGHTPVLDYLARYVHRIAITNTRILAMDHATVTFRYKQRNKAAWRTCTLGGHEFIRRFLQHVLPKGFHKVRYYGLWHPSKRALRRTLRITLNLACHYAGSSHQHPTHVHTILHEAQPQQPRPVCPYCKGTNTCHLATLNPLRHIPQARPHPSPRASPNTHTTT